MPPEKITEFRGDYFFLSNFFPCLVIYKSIRWGSSEVPYMWEKPKFEEDRSLFDPFMKPGKAKRLGRKIQLRPDWEEVKINIMRDILRCKFSREKMRDRLLATGDAYLEEGNTWGDTIWGVCNGVGENHLGKILMEIREDLR